MTSPPNPEIRPLGYIIPQIKCDSRHPILQTASDLISIERRLSPRNRHSSPAETSNERPYGKKQSFRADQAVMRPRKACG